MQHRIENTRRDDDAVVDFLAARTRILSALCRRRLSCSRTPLNTRVCPIHGRRRMRPWLPGVPRHLLITDTGREVTVARLLARNLREI